MRRMRAVPPPSEIVLHQEREHRSVHTSKTIDDAIGERIRDARIKSDLTLVQLGDRADIPRALIADFEAGLRRPTPEQLIAICKTLGLTLFEVFGGPET